MATSWLFDLNRDGSSEGWEDAAIKNFRGNPLNNLAREIIQNSLDAPKLEDSKIVTVSFQKETVKTTEVPDIKVLGSTINKCLKAADTFVLPDKQENLVLAKDTVNSNKIDILRITESGTAGMEGPCEPGKPLYKYMKAKGQGGKSFDGARGSHGQGKAAPILCSQLHTIFVSTNWMGANQVMGRATLSSHYGNSKKEIHNNVGYWGKDFDPVKFGHGMPDWLRRDEPGTNIVVLGFKQFARWNEILIASVAVNFFAAIHQGHLTVIVQGFEINKDTLPEIFDRPRIIQLIESQSDVPRDDFERAKGYFETYIKPQEVEEGEVLNLGFFRFYLSKREDNQQNIGLLRDDMFITSEIPRLKRKFGSSYEGFDLLIEPASKASRSLIKSMEPPAHDGLNTSWIDDPTLRSKVEAGMTHLRRRVVEILDRHLKIEVGGSEYHAVFDKFFSVSGGGEQISDATDPNGGFVFSNRQVNETFQSSVATMSGAWSHDLDIEELEKGNSSSNDIQVGSDDTKNKDNAGHPPELGSKAAADSLNEFKSKPVELTNVKMRSLSPVSVMLQFEPRYGGRLKLNVAEQGSDLKTLIMLKDANVGEVAQDGGLYLSCGEGEKVRVEITLHKPLNGALSLLASGA